MEDLRSGEEWIFRIADAKAAEESKFTADLRG